MRARGGSWKRRTISRIEENLDLIECVAYHPAFEDLPEIRQAAAREIVEAFIDRNEPLAARAQRRTNGVEHDPDPRLQRIGQRIAALHRWLVGAASEDGNRRSEVSRP